MAFAPRRDRVAAAAAAAPRPAFGGMAVLPPGPVPSTSEIRQAKAGALRMLVASKIIKRACAELLERGATQLAV